MQATDLNLVGQVSGGMEDAPAYLVAQCKDWRQAADLCMALAKCKRSRGAWADLLGMSAGALAVILNRSGGRKRKLDADEINTIQKAAGNRAISQWMDMDLAGQLNHQNIKAKRIHELKEELQALQGEFLHG